MTYWTITYGGFEKSMEDWGIMVNLSVEFVSKTNDSVPLTTVEPFDPVTPQFVPMQPILIQRDRVKTGGSFSGGTVFFRGYVGEMTMEGDGTREAIGYQLYGPWWLLERLPFKQSRKVWSGYVTPGEPTSGNTFQTVFLAESFLGEDPTEMVWSAKEAIGEVLGYALECWNPTRRGNTISNPSAVDASQDPFIVGTIDCDIKIPRDRVVTGSCAECIVKLLRLFPAVAVWFDYALTNPPTLNMRDVTNLTPLSLTITAEQEESITIVPQYDRQMDGVMICYKQINYNDGNPFPGLWKDVYPWAIDDYSTGIVTHVFDLQGSKVTHYTGAVTITSLAPAKSATKADRVAFWLLRDTTLRDPLIKPDSIDVDQIGTATTSVLDDSGAPVNLSLYPNILEPGCQVSGWMGVRWVWATIQTNATFKKYKNTNFLGKGTKGTRPIHCRRILTNATTKTYSAISSLDTGEALPVGVIDAATPNTLWPLAPTPPGWWPAAGSFAKSLYDSLHTLQYQGAITFVGQEARADIKPGMVLTLVGPNHTYSNLLVQSVTVHPHQGKVTVKFGPISRLDAPGLLELWRAARLRTLYNMPSGRSSGTAPADVEVTQTGASHASDTMHGQAAYNSFGISTPV